MGLLKKTLVNIKGLFSKINGQADKIKNEKHFNLGLIGLIHGRYPKLNQLKTLPDFLSFREKKAIKGLWLLIFLCILGLGISFYYNHSRLIPKNGGSYTEGLLGVPQYINPLLASYNDVDRDLSALIFNGLLKINNEGSLETDLAESYEISPDKKIYTFKLKENVVWHDGSHFTADDVIFTAATIQDPAWQSQLKTVLSNVSVEKISNYGLRFVLKESVANFASSLTFGILPQHLWRTIPASTATLADLNKKPVGTGPFKFKSLTKDKNGNIRTIVLERNGDYFKKPPYIAELRFKFYGDYESAVSALKNKNVEGLSLLPKEQQSNLKNDRNLNFYSLSLPQYTAVFFNTKNSEPLKSKIVRQALTYAIDRAKILNESLSGKGVVLNGPIPPGYAGFNADLNKYSYNPDEAKKLLSADGWKIGEDGKYLQKNKQQIEINLTTVENSEYQKASEIIKANWEAVGVKTNLEIIAKERIRPDIIEPRNYQALLYGQIIKADLYPLWHSSQNQNPFANLAVWSNRDVDTLLEEAKISADQSAINQKYIKFQEILSENAPAIFLYNPIQIYPVDKKVHGITTRRVNTMADRFIQITDWYIKTKRIFSLEKN